MRSVSARAAGRVEIPYVDMVSARPRIFYPDLTRPQKEQYVDYGWKRIDILFHNSAVSGFLPALSSSTNTLRPTFQSNARTTQKTLGIRNSINY